MTQDDDHGHLPDHDREQRAHIDAIATNGSADGTFNFIGGQAFSGVAGQMCVYATADGQLFDPTSSH